MLELTIKEEKVCCKLLLEKIASLEARKRIIIHEIKSGCNIKYMIDDIEDEISDLREIIEKKARLMNFDNVMEAIKEHIDIYLKEYSFYGHQQKITHGIEVMMCIDKVNQYIDSLHEKGIIDFTQYTELRYKVEEHLEYLMEIDDDVLNEIQLYSEYMERGEL